MNSSQNFNKLIFRKLKLSDYPSFEKLFKKTYKKKISYEFFKWRYFFDKYSFCYGVFESSNLIANVGMVSMQSNSAKKPRIYSRHSSMVAKKYRGKGIFSQLLKEVKKKIISKSTMVIMWPNKNNFSTFGINKNLILKRKFYLYKSLNLDVKHIETNSINLNELKKFRLLINNKKNFFFKNYNYFYKRYFLYKRNEYFINFFEFENKKSFFIVKKNRYKYGKNYIVLEHFGSIKIKQIHLRNLMKEKRELLFWSNIKMNKSNLNLIAKINLNVGLMKNISYRNKKSIINNKIFMPGDTDTFISLR